MSWIASRSANVAVTVLLASIVTLHVVASDVAQPVHPMSEVDVAASATAVPDVNDALHVPGQLIPAPVTIPVPELDPAIVTVSVTVGVGVGGGEPHTFVADDLLRGAGAPVEKSALLLSVSV